MAPIIYIKLLNEGTDVYRPVSAFHIQDQIYELGGADIYDSDDEVWEFLPGTFVLVEERVMEGEIASVAITKAP